MNSEDYWSIHLGYVEPNKHKIKMSARTEEILYDIDCYTDNILEGLESEQNIIEESHKIKNALRKLGVLAV